MKLFVSLLFVLISFSALFAFDIKTIDETEEGKKKVLEITRAADGKVIVKPISKTILQPIKVTIIKGYKPTIEPIQRRIIYPIGTLPPKTVEQKQVESLKTQKKEENVFLSSDSISNKKSDEISINIDTDFKKSPGTTTPDKPRTISPVSIE